MLIPSWNQAKNNKEQRLFNLTNTLRRAFARTQANIQINVRRSELEASIWIIIFFFKYSTHGLFKNFGRKYLENERVFQALDGFFAYGSNAIPIPGLGSFFWFSLFATIIIVLTLVYAVIFVANLKKKDNYVTVPKEQKFFKFLADCFSLYFWLMFIPATELMLAQFFCSVQGQDSLNDYLCVSTENSLGVWILSIVFLFLNFFHSMISVSFTARSMPIKGKWDPLGSQYSNVQLKILVFTSVNYITQAIVRSPSNLSKTIVLLKNIVINTYLIYEILSRISYFNAWSINILFSVGIVFTIFRNFLRLTVLILDLSGNLSHNNFEGFSFIILTPFLVKVLISTFKKKEEGILNIKVTQKSAKFKLFEHLKLKIMFIHTIKNILQKHGPDQEKEVIYKEKIIFQGLRKMHMAECNTPSCYCKISPADVFPTSNLLEFMHLSLNAQFNMALNSKPGKQASWAQISLLAASFYMTFKHFIRVYDHLAIAQNLSSIRTMIDSFCLLAEVQNELKVLTLDKKNCGKKVLSPFLDHIFYYEKGIVSLESSIGECIKNFESFWSSLLLKVINIRCSYEHGSKILSIKREVIKQSNRLENFIHENSYYKLCNHKLILGAFYHFILNDLAKGDRYLKGYQLTKSISKRAEAVQKQAKDTFSSKKVIGYIFDKDLAVLRASLLDRAIITGVSSEGCNSVFFRKPEELMGQYLELLVPRILREIHIEYIKKFKETGECSILRQYRDENIFLTMEEGITQGVGLYVRFSNSCEDRIDFVAAIKLLNLTSDMQHIITNEKGKVDSLSRHLHDIIISSYSSDKGSKKSITVATEVLPSVFQICRRLAGIYRIFNKVNLSPNPLQAINSLSARKQRLYERLIDPGFEILLKISERGQTISSNSYSAQRSSVLIATESHSISGQTSHSIREIRCLCRIKDKVLQAGTIMRILYLKLIEERTRTITNSEKGFAKNKSMNQVHVPSNVASDDSEDFYFDTKSPDKKVAELEKPVAATPGFLNIDMDMLIAKKNLIKSLESPENSLSEDEDSEVSEEVFGPERVEKKRLDLGLQINIINEPINEDSKESEEDQSLEKRKSSNRTIIPSPPMMIHNQNKSLSHPHETSLRSLNDQQGEQLLIEVEDDKIVRGGILSPEKSEERKKNNLLSKDEKLKGLLFKESNNMNYFKIMSLGFTISLIVLMLVLLFLGRNNNDNVWNAYHYYGCSTERALSLLSIQKEVRVAYAHKKGIRAQPTLNESLIALKKYADNLLMEVQTCDPEELSLAINSRKKVIDVYRSDSYLNLQKSETTLFTYLMDLIAKLYDISDSSPSEISLLNDIVFKEILINNPNSILIFLSAFNDELFYFLLDVLYKISFNRKIFIGVCSVVLIVYFVAFMTAIILTRMKLELIWGLLVRLKARGVRGILLKGKIMRLLLERKLKSKDERESDKQTIFKAENESDSEFSQTKRSFQKKDLNKKERLTNALKRQSKSGDFKDFHDKPHFMIGKLILLILPSALYFVLGFYLQELRNQVQFNLLDTYKIVVNEWVSEKKLDVAMNEILMTENEESPSLENINALEYLENLLLKSTSDSEISKALNAELKGDKLLNLISNAEYCYKIFERDFCNTNLNLFKQGYLQIRANKINLLLKLLAIYSSSDKTSETRATLVSGTDFTLALILSDIDFKTLKLLQISLLNQQDSLNHDRDYQRSILITISPFIFVFSFLYLYLVIVRKIRVLLEMTREMVALIPCELILSDKFATANLKLAFRSIQRS